ncbi:hypothetical protein GCM10027429_31410 [Marivirga atlantica]|jgi:outer membrane protein TolC|uniref:TolC family protein n=1 Tax=Marivirga atlantica TaxID=1548457 RepID=A0A937AJM8_9BACT|nr:TolC family protein [Marivirga atlantica]MBL0766719.1 TolC family protein [Marivirga atlantica]
MRAIFSILLQLISSFSFVIYLTSIFCLLTSNSLEAQSLSDYQKIAAENNPGLQAAYKQFEAALQSVNQQNRLPDPTVSMGYFLSPIETRVGPQQAKFSLTQMFPWFGSLKAQGNAAALMADAQYQTFLEVRSKLCLQVATAYYPLYELRRWQSIEIENIEVLEAYKAIAQHKFENGAGTMVDVLRVDIMLQDAQTNLEILKKKEDPLQVAFNNLLNRKEDVEVLVSDTLKADLINIPLTKDSLFIENPVLESLEFKVKASKAKALVAQKQGMPKIGVGLDYMLVGKRTDAGAPANNGKDALMPMVSISLPIFRRKYHAARKEAELMQESYTLQKKDYRNQLSSNYELALFELKQQVDYINLYDRQIAESKQMLTLLLSAYGNAGQDFEEVLRVQQKLLKYQKQMATALKVYHIKMAELNYLTASN